MKRRTFVLAATLSCVAVAAEAAPTNETTPFDHSHAAWTQLLAQHVAWNADGTATSVDYAGFARDRAALDAYRDELASVTRSDFDAWDRNAKLAFLINAYNAHTVALILTKYPELESIKDLGGVFSPPWKQRFFTLLGEERHLDDVEHGLIRGAPGYDEPRIHFAVNCASIGCPALRPEAYVGATLDAQLDDQTKRFLRDPTRNRYDAASTTLYVSKIFDWYEADFTPSVAVFVARHVDGFAADSVEIEYLDYDWRLNGR
ncbi:MAG TPA: DUF547 domain-containing protein [Xanthomonadales bacterium]|nr:DUF547 domain-containing protein [Xanthomonadales bacterium]